MSAEEKAQLERMKMFKVTEGTPEDLSKAIQTFIQQAVIIGEYELDSMPPEHSEPRIYAGICHCLKDPARGHRRPSFSWWCFWQESLLRRVVLRVRGGLLDLSRL